MRFLPTPAFALAIVMAASIIAPATLRAAPAAAPALGSTLADASQVTTAGARVRRERQPLKDCTRYNSRYGFYGNIWCTEREQELWDRYGSTRKRPKT